VANQQLRPRDRTPAREKMMRRNSALKQRNPGRRLRLRRRSEVLLLVNDIVVRILGIPLVLEDAHGPVHDIAVLIEGYNALQRLKACRLHGIAHVGAIDCLATFGDALDRVEHHQRTVVGGDRIVARESAGRMLPLVMRVLSCPCRASARPLATGRGSRSTGLSSSCQSRCGEVPAAGRRASQARAPQSLP
jgi:hypothetical protein